VVGMGAVVVRFRAIAESSFAGPPGVPSRERGTASRHAGRFCRRRGTQHHGSIFFSRFDFKVLPQVLPKSASATPRRAIGRPSGYRKTPVFPEKNRCRRIVGLV